MEHVVIAMGAKLPAPDKPVLIALALGAGHDATISIDTLAFRSGYDAETVRQSIDRLLASNVIYRPYPDDPSRVQFTRMGEDHGI